MTLWDGFRMGYVVGAGALFALGTFASVAWLARAFLERDQRRGE